MTAMPHAPPSAPPAHAPRPRDRSAAIALSIVAVLLIACAGAGVGLWRMYDNNVKHSDDASVATPQAMAGSVPHARDGIVVVARFKLDDLAAIRVGQAARVRLQGAPGQVWPGRVQAVGAEHGQDTGSAGNVVGVVQRRPVRIAVDAPPRQRALFRPGVAARVEIDIRSGP
ncbi:hypothetical protein [Xanthomonas theicola]|uniref:HlyD family secretion protein n=2 Tax=Xanthomonas theicola TaxID=56464 RepID=UPI001C8D6E7D|nr:hypothetical protein [Xanthomonas theicola]